MTQEQWRKKLDGYFISFCRKAFRWSPVYAEMRQAFKRNPKCTICGKKMVQRRKGKKLTLNLKEVDHTIPIGKWTGSWDEYRDKMFVNSSKLQNICRSCHLSKSHKELVERKK